MEKDGAGAKPEKETKEGFLLLGVPKFSDLGNGRLRCKATGHELPIKEKESYIKSKACRLALIDATVAKKKAPLNLFEQCSNSKSKLVCQLTGDIINKSEEHIWKHINGKRFLNKLEEKEMEDVALLKTGVKKVKEPKKIKRQPEATECKQAIKVNNDNASENHGQNNNDSEEELEFWIPPVGERWDADDGKDRWDDDGDSEQELCDDDDNKSADKQDDPESTELSSRKKRKCRSSSMKKRRKKRKAMKALKTDSK